MLFALCFGSGTVQAQNPTQHVVGKRHALLIGLNYGWTDHPKIAYAHHCAFKLGEELKGYGFSSPHLLVGEQATRAMIVRALKDIVSMCDEDDELLVYFMGHGVRKQNQDGTRIHALVPADCSEQSPLDALLLTRDVVRVLQLGRARNTVFILSTCHSGQVIDDLTRVSWWVEKKKGTRPQSISVLAAAAATQLAFGNESETSSFFLDGIIDGLRAIAPLKSGVVRAGELYIHTQKYLRSKTQGQQQPQFAQFGPNEFLFVRGIPLLQK